MRQTADSDEFHQRLIGLLVVDDEPDREGDQRDDEDGALDGQAQPQDARHGELEDDQAEDDAVADYGPGSTGGVLAVVHGVEELVLVDEGAEKEVEQAEEEDEPGTREGGVDDADDEDEDRLREVEAVAEDWGLDQFGAVAWCPCADTVEWVDGHGAEFEEAKWEEGETLEDDEIHVKEDEGFQGAGEDVGD